MKYPISQHRYRPKSVVGMTNRSHRKEFSVSAMTIMKAVILSIIAFYMGGGCIEKMTLPTEIQVEFSVGDTTYLKVNPEWNMDEGFPFLRPTEISIAPDGHVFVVDSMLKSIFVLSQDGVVLEAGFQALRNLTLDDGTPLTPLDVDIDRKMNVFFVDGSQKIYCWNQYWNDVGIDSVAVAGTFSHPSYGDSTVATGSNAWMDLISDPDWYLNKVQWSNDQTLIDSLLQPHVFYDGSWLRNVYKDVHYESAESRFSALSTTKDVDNYLYVTDNVADSLKNRLVKILFEPAGLIRLSTGVEVWAFRGVFGQTVVGFGTGAGKANHPVSIDVDGDGNIYYTQEGQFFAVHKIKPVTTGAYIIYPSVFQPQVNDIMDLSRFQSPQDVAVDLNQYIYVANTGAQEIQVFDADGKFFKKAGVQTITVDTTLWMFNGTDSVQVDTFLTVETKGILMEPSAVTVDDRGVIYVCDTPTGSILRFQLSNKLDENLQPLP